MKRRGWLWVFGLSMFTLAAAPVFAASPTSGFIDDAPALAADQKRPGAFVYRAEGKSLKGYTKVVIDPILVWYHPDSKYQGMEPKELAELTSLLQQQLTDDLEPEYPVVGEGGAGVLRLRLAITQIRAEKKKKGLLNYTPMGLVVGAAKSAGQITPNLNLMEAQVEAELLDAGDDTRLAVVVEPLVTSKEKDQKLTWDKISGVLDAYAKRLRARLDEANAAK